MFEKNFAVGREVKGLEKGQWVQTEKKAHEAWAHFCIKKPSASGLLHYMCAFMGEQNALVISQLLLSKKLGVSTKTISTAIKDLAAGNWIQVVSIGKGKECAYVVNDRVAWDKPRDKLSLSIFSATVVSDAAEQAELDGPPLRRIPVLFPGERQLPTGPGEEPPSQPSIPGMEPDLPSIHQAELEARGQQRLTLEGVDPTTGEIYERERRRLGLPEGAELPDPFKAKR